MMSQATLSTELQNLEPVSTEPEAIQNLVDAYGNFANSALGNGIPLTPAGLALGKAAMTTALVGMSTSGLTVIPTAIITFWAAVCTGFLVSFPGSIASTPPPHATLSTLFPVVCSNNTSSEVSLEDAADNIASLFYTQAITGGTVTLPPAIVGPIL